MNTLRRWSARLTLLVRADIDALPTENATGREYASKIPNRNHACGHDAHSAIVVGVATLLAGYRDRIAGRTPSSFSRLMSPCVGAKRMIEDGVLDWVKPDLSLAIKAGQAGPASLGAPSR